jgi:hypothetical protein
MEFEIKQVFGGSYMSCINVFIIWAKHTSLPFGLLLPIDFMLKSLCVSV